MSFDNIDQPKEEQTKEPTTSFENGQSGNEQQGESQETPKYGTDIDKLNKRLQDKDAFINQLLDERKQDRERFGTISEKLSSMEEKIGLFESSNDILEKLKDHKPEKTDHVETSQNSDPKDEPHLDPNYLREQGFLTREDLQAEEQRKQREQNLKQIAGKLQEKFGDKIDENVSRLAEEADMTFDEAFELAGKKPKAFERLFLGGASQSKGSATGFTSSVNTSAMQDEPAQKVDYMKMSTEERIRHNMQRLEALSKGQ